MSQWDKLLARIYTLSKDLRFAELKKVLESYGYTDQFPIQWQQSPYLSEVGLRSNYDFARHRFCLRRVRSAIARNRSSLVELCPTFFPKHKPIKRVYIEMVRDIILSEEENDEDA